MGGDSFSVQRSGGGLHSGARDGDMMLSREGAVHETVGQGAVAVATDRRERPILTLVAAKDSEPRDLAVDGFWQTVAAVATDAVTLIPFEHPDAQALRQFVAHVRHAAGLPPLQDASPPRRRRSETG